MMIHIELNDQLATWTVCEPRLRMAVQRILADHGPPAARISIAVVDDATMHALNRRHLQHDYPTDVLSFVLEEADDLLEGEIIVSSDTAVAQAARFGLEPDDELLLYVIHGMLHLVGFDDQSPEKRREMRCAERRYLKELGVVYQEHETHDDPA
jgi:probable rRNA maturation factor